MSGSGSNRSGSTAGSRVSGGGRSSSGSNENVVPLPPNLIVPLPPNLIVPLPPSLSLGSSGADPSLSLGSSGADSNYGSYSGGGGTSLSAQVGSSRQYLSQEIGSGSGDDGFHGSSEGSQVSAPASSSEGTPAPDLPIPAPDLPIPAIPADLPIPDEVSPPSKKPRTDEHPSKDYSYGETIYEAYISFLMPQGKTPKDFVFELSSTNMTIGFRGSDPIIDKGALLFPVRPEFSFWRLVRDSFLTISLVKESSGVVWKRLLDPDGGGITDSNFRDMNPQPSD